jgi:hypothetical protein
MPAEGRYVAALLSALITPAGDLSRWLESGDGAPPVEMAYRTPTGGHRDTDDL